MMELCSTNYILVMEGMGHDEGRSHPQGGVVLVTMHVLILWSWMDLHLCLGCHVWRLAATS